MKIQCYVLDRFSHAIKSAFQSVDFEINIDYLTNEKSYFIPLEAHTASQGDFLVAKHLDFGRHGDSDFVPMYFGVIDSFENTKLICCDIYNLLNFNIAAVRISGTNVAQHLQQLISLYLLNDPGKSVGSLVVLTDGSEVAFSYQPSDPPTPTNFTEYLIGCFQKYNVVWSVDRLLYQSSGVLQIVSSLKLITKTIRLKNNAYAFTNWDVYVDPGGGSDFNKCVIVDKTTTSMVDPTVLATYYIETDGDIVSTLTSGVHIPTRDKVYVYDTSSEDKPSYLQVARSELSASRYAHEISFDLLKDNKLVSFDELCVGTLSTIIYDDVTYPSVLTGYRISATNSLISLKFGNIRSTLQQVLMQLKERS